MTERQVEEPEAPPSILEELLRKSHQFVEEAVANRVKDSVDRALAWTFRRVVTYLSAAALFATAAVFLMVGGTQGLAQAGIPSWAAYLGFGVLGGAGGYLLMKSPSRQSRNGG